MPRRGGGGMKAPARPAPVRSVPAPRPAAPPAPQQPKQPGLFAQMATTAAGVAVGSAVGHTIGAAMTGGMGGGAAEQQQPAAPQQYGQPEQQQNACGYELQRFLDCSNQYSDVSLCSGFLEALKSCRTQYGLQQ
ncbi:coiled-coil-helix-coiled-coil-helix domain-containing protein 10, mitochondrial-like [Lingula anatina]|uniref:Coiled-coil-helix-coiled-coil-helix domain-containing protein 10, mitochondrial-like n=1 Tax=Lingula anatina TaxID=7574 RepID=A0A1S3HXU6_LINAN|nr:coiled-coil-helix-coiled-coil-helix domain-containing protein 10, mitochondrial-like [Lingula anatina]|eukprot:XP_013389894.1 coiled-coil-helix-coiled-coil-helix domain-containing protein 10, mitochondrial-like [Lingula anatina]